MAKQIKGVGRKKEIVTKGGWTIRMSLPEVKQKRKISLYTACPWQGQAALNTDLSTNIPADTSNDKDNCCNALKSFCG